MHVAEVQRHVVGLPSESLFPVIERIAMNAQASSFDLDVLGAAAVEHDETFGICIVHLSQCMNRHIEKAQAGGHGIVDFGAVLTWLHASQEVLGTRFKEILPRQAPLAPLLAVGVQFLIVQTVAPW